MEFVYQVDSPVDFCVSGPKQRFQHRCLFLILWEARLPLLPHLKQREPLSTNVIINQLAFIS